MKSRYRNICRVLIFLSIMAVHFTVPPQTAYLHERDAVAVFTVTNNLDTGAGSFRQAIIDANAAAGTDTIQFQIGTGPVTISHSSSLPEITQPVIIDGTTQPGYSGTPLIRLSGNFTVGLKITGGGSTLKALALANFQNGIILENSGGNIITACFIGPNFGNGALINNSPNNMIGGATEAERNIISANGTNGIEITGATSSGNVIAGNYIGILADDSAAGNTESGVVIRNAPGNRVGGTTAGERNVVSFNGTQPFFNLSESGVLISGAGASGNVVQGNYIGTGIDGTTPPGTPNTWNGVRIEDAANNTIGGAVGTTPGGACTGTCNLISGFGGIGTQSGLTITGTGASGNSVLGNFIGTNLAGTARIDNDQGIVITDAASNNTVGGTAASGRNMINNGIWISSGAATNIVQGNYIGTDTTGNTGIGFIGSGLFTAAVTIEDAANNQIGTAAGTTLGGACTGGCNLISGNTASDGVVITGAGSTGNRVDYNYIGLNAAGTAALRNGGRAIAMQDGANNNTIGRPITTSQFQEAKQVENAQLNNNNICVQDDTSGDYITFKLSSDVRTATYTAVHAKSGETVSGTVDVSLGQSTLGLFGGGLRMTVEFSSGKAIGHFKFPPPSNIDLSIIDTNTGDSTCVRQVADNGMQTVVGTITNGSTSLTDPYNNIYNLLLIGCSANEINNLSNETVDQNFINQGGNFNVYSNNLVCTRGENEAVVIANGTDNYIEGTRIRRVLGGPLFFHREIDLHDDNTTNPPGPNPGPGANRSQNSPQFLSVRREGRGILSINGTLNSDRNQRYLIRLSAVLQRKPEFLENEPLTETIDTGLTFEVMTDGNGNATISHLVAGVDAFYIALAINVTMTATLINQVPIASENSVTSFVDVLGDTSEFSLPAIVPKPQFDFDEDGKTDIAVYRAGAAQNDLSFWHILNSSDSTVRIVQFGNGEDKPVAGDYQGDGVTDFAVFRPSNATWYNSRLTGDPATNFQTIQLGVSTDIPVPGDYFDIGSLTQAVFRPSESNWYIRNPFDGTVATQNFGQAGDKLVPADYNGDGRTDPAVFRNGMWEISVCPACTVDNREWGQAGDVPVPADHDGDGIDDLAVFRPATGEWLILQSRDGAVTYQLGSSAQKLVAGDYDADGKVDVAVWDPATGDWSIRNSSDGTITTMNLGQAGDIPVSAYLNQPIASTAASASVSGRVLDQSGRGISRAQVSIIGPGGDVRTAMSNTFGYYRIDGIPTGPTYIVRLSQGRYTFPLQVLAISESLENVDFIGVRN